MYVKIFYLMFSGEYSSQLHAAGIPSLLASLVTELAADNISNIQVCWLLRLKLCIAGWCVISVF